MEKRINDNNNNSSKLKSGLFILAGLFLITGFLTVKFYRDVKGVETKLEAEKNQLISDLQKLEDDYEEMALEKDGMTVELQNARLEILQYIDSLKNRRMNPAMLSRVKHQIASLKRERDMLMAQNDSLKYGMQMLQAEKDSTVYQLELKGNLNDSLLNRVVNLQKIIDENSKLNVNKISLEGAKERSNGKLFPTKKASKASTLKICFTVEENKLVGSGDLDFYISVKDSSGKVLGANKTADNDNGEEIAYSIISNFYYDSESSIDVCDYLNKDENKFSKGEYNVKIYDEDLKKIGDYITTLR